MTNFKALLFQCFFMATLGSLGTPARSMEPLTGKMGVIVPWSDLDAEKRCEGLLAFTITSAKVANPNWTLEKPECVISGSVGGDMSWSLNGRWRLGAKTLPLRYTVVYSQKNIKTLVQWCVIKGSKAGCSNVWSNSFNEGDLYPSPAEAREAFDGVSKISTGFLNIATKIDEWVGIKTTGEKIFALNYTDWIKIWVNAPRSLPTKDGPAQGIYETKGALDTSGSLEFKGKVPPSLAKCLGCENDLCPKGSVNFRFSGITLVLERAYSEAQQRKTELKYAQALWVMTAPTPFESGKPLWPMFCGVEKFTIQKF